MEEEGGVLTLEAKEEVLLEVDAVAFLEILVEEVKELTNQRFNSITVKGMGIMHINIEINSIIITTKSRLVKKCK